MIQNTTFSALSHEPGRSALAPEFDRVDDEYVFVVVADDADRPDERCPLAHSIRVDPADGRDGELVLHVTKRCRDETAAVSRESFTVTVPAPGLGDPPRVFALESTLNAWFNQRDGAPTSLEAWFNQHRTAHPSETATPCDREP